MKRQVTIEIICFLLIVLFVYAAMNKLMDVEKFRVQIGQSPLLTAFAGWLSWSVPVFELVISVMLTFSQFRLVGLYASFTLMVMFTAYIVIIMNFSEFIPCSCGGVLEKLGWGEHLVFNIVFVILSLLGIVFFSKDRVENLSSM